MEKLYPLFRIAELIAKEKIGELSESENKHLQQWLNENDQNRQLYNKLQNEKKLVSEIEELKKVDTYEAYRKVLSVISKEDKHIKEYRLIPRYVKYAAAIGILVISTYFLARYILQPEVTTVAQSTIVVGKPKAILITSNNQSITLDSLANQQLMVNEDAQVFQNGATLRYTTSDSLVTTSDEIAYNSLITPLGAEYTIVLSDGTEVILNAGSKLKYPVVFTGPTREVELEGEAFFKVAKSAVKPFFVIAHEITTKVYGTSFNISAYINDETFQTTLIEGCVGISAKEYKPGMETKLVPGEQFIYNKGNGDSKVKAVSTEQYIAWTKGMFVFENEPIENILKVLARWYNFSYEFKDESLKNQRFTINLDRYSHVSKILDLISASSGLKFEASGSTILIKNKI